MTALPERLRARLRLALEQVGLRPRRSFALNELDLKLLPFIGFRGGFFVEAGGNDGLSQSNTAYFERYLGWRGLLIEPIPSLAARCRENRPRSKVEQCALVPFGNPEREVELHYCNLMSLVVGARGSAEADAAHLELGKTFLAAGDEPYVVRAPARTLSDVLDQHHVKRIDLLSLDVEGYEPQALRGLDLERHRPQWVLVEANDPAAVAALLASHYELKAELSHHDKLYQRREGAVR